VVQPFVLPYFPRHLPSTQQAAAARQPAHACW
jgi:hypothetical protein